MKNWFINKFKLIDDIINDFLKDLKSFRVQLIYAAYIFNLIILWAIIFKGLDWKTLTVSFGMLTIIYAFYFKSKSDQNIIEANLKSKI